MEKRKSSQEAEVAEQPCASASFYGTSTPKKPKNDHVGLIVTACLLIIGISTMSSLGVFQAQRSAETESPVSEAASGDDVFQADLEIRAAGTDREASALPVLTLQQPGTALDEAARRDAVSPSAVQVSADFYERSERSAGVLFTQDGYLLAGCGDLRQAYTITCTRSDGSALPAAFVGFDEQTGLALLKLCGEDFPAARFSSTSGSAADALLWAEDGEALWPVSLHAGAGGTWTVDAGSTALDPGAPLIASDGSVAGLIVSQDGQTRAVPASALPEVLTQILSQNAAAGLWLGFDAAEVPPMLAGYYDYPGTLWVRGIFDERLADAGLYAYDILLTADGESISSWADFNNALAQHLPGECIELTLYRDGKIIKAILPVCGR